MMRAGLVALALATPLLIAGCSVETATSPPPSPTPPVVESMDTKEVSVTGRVGEDITVTYTRDEANPGFTFWVVGADSGVLSSVADVDNETSIPCVGTVTFEALKPGVVRLAFADADSEGNVTGPTTLYDVTISP